MHIENLWATFPTIDWSVAEEPLSRISVPGDAPWCHHGADALALALYCSNLEVLRCYGDTRKTVPRPHSWVEVRKSELLEHAAPDFELMASMSWDLASFSYPESILRLSEERDSEWIVIDGSRLKADGTGAFIERPSCYQHHYLRNDIPVQGRLTVPVWLNGTHAGWALGFDLQPNGDIELLHPALYDDGWKEINQ